MDTIKFVDLIPKIERRPQDRCSCNNARINMYHIVFVCQKYIEERKQIIDMLIRDKKWHSIKEILSDDEEYCEDEVHQSFNIQISSCVAIAYEGAWWLGTIREINEAEKDVMVQFLHPKGPSTTFHLTNRDNINFITFEDIHGQITVPKPQTCSLRKYIIESNDLKLINKKWLDFISSSKK